MESQKEYFLFDLPHYPLDRTASNSSPPQIPRPQDHRSQGGLDNSQPRSANVFRVDDPRSEPGVLHELTQKKMAEDAESDIAIRFGDEND